MARIVIPERMNHSDTCHDKDKIHARTPTKGTEKRVTRGKTTEVDARHKKNLTKL